MTTMLLNPQLQLSTEARASEPCGAMESVLMLAVIQRALRRAACEDAKERMPASTLAVADVVAIAHCIPAALRCTVSLPPPGPEGAVDVSLGSEFHAKIYVHSKLPEVRMCAHGASGMTSLAAGSGRRRAAADAVGHCKRRDGAGVAVLWSDKGGVRAH